MYWEQMVLKQLRQAVMKNKLYSSAMLCQGSELVLTTTMNKVTTLTMNNPAKLNGWTVPMVDNIAKLLEDLGKGTDTKAVILTGSDPYYCAGAELSKMIKIMSPKKLHRTRTEYNAFLFNIFLDFPKPILIAVNGPAIGAAVTSAALCDGVIASEKATFLTPFGRLGVPGEGCSTVHFERILGKEVTDKMLKENWEVSAEEARMIGLVSEVVAHKELMERAQMIAESWVAEGRERTIPGGGKIEEYKEINAAESVKVADAFLSYEFLNGQYKFLTSKGKIKDARVFWIMKTFHPFWSKLL